MKSAMVSLSLFCTVLFAMPADAPPDVWMEVPSLKLNVEANGSALIHSDAVDSFIIHIRKQPGQVDYGSITSKINTESSNMVMTTSSGTDGIHCIFELGREGGFRLKQGRNSVEISYRDRWQRLHYASFLLEATQAPLGPMQPEGRPETLRASKYAVIIGISRYQNNGRGLKNLVYADRDALAMRDFLLSPEGGSFPRENILYLVNEDATAQAVRSAFFTFLTRPKEDDLVVIYFAGHGAADPNDRRNLYLLTYDTKPDDMGGTAFPMWQLQDVFTRILRSRRVITFADSCHSYGISGESFGAAEKSNNLINQYLTSVARTSERAVITASDISQLSMEGQQWGGGHGVFTYYVLQGLQGQADLNHDGVVTTGELFYYVRDQVDAATNGNQTPVALPGLAATLSLTKVASGTASAPASAVQTAALH